MLTLIQRLPRLRHKHRNTRPRRHARSSPNRQPQQHRRTTPRLHPRHNDRRTPIRPGRSARLQLPKLISIRLPERLYTGLVSVSTNVDKELYLRGEFAD